MARNSGHADDDERAVAGDGVGRNRLRIAEEKALDETRKFLVMFLYLFVLFGVLVIYEAMILKKYDLEFTSYGLALVNALVMAKIMLVADALHTGRRFEGRPLIYPIALKSLMFAAIFIVFHVVEETAVGVWRGKSIIDSVPKFGGGGLEGLLAVGVIVSFALVPFFIVTELSRVLGGAEMRALIFKRRSEEVVVEFKWRAEDGGRDK